MITPDGPDLLTIQSVRSHYRGGVVKTVRSVYCGVILGLLLWGCGTSEDTQEETSARLDTLKQAPAQDLQFDVKEDTVAAVRQSERESIAADSAALPSRYAVQIGAFKDPQNAGAAQAKAKERFPHPVFNDFDPKSGLYQIRIGSFDSQETAYAFRLSMQRLFPGDYGDSWVVQMRK